MQGHQPDSVLSPPPEGEVAPATEAEEYPLYVYSLFEHLMAKMASYATPVDIEFAKKAFFMAYELHKEQTRKSGEPYFIHPYEVALILTELNAGGEMIAAGFLHDILEDTDYTAEQMKEAMGETVLHLVDGVTKLSQFSFSSKEERQAENFRRMFLAMAQDIRVVVIKLADRLHNMRTLEHMTEEKQRKIAQETLDIFAPLAHRLGIGRLKWELEDLCLRYLHPQHYWEITSYIAQKRQEREDIIQSTIAELEAECKAYEIKADIKGRPKNFYSIYNKLTKHQKEFQDIYDFFGMRVMVENEKSCYEVLGIVHSLWKPIPGRFKDYIAMPKQNMYQSLHTTVIAPSGHPLEVQIRTREMDRIAEFGIAAHWKYKEGAANKQLRKNDLQLTWLRQLLEWQNDLKDAKEYLDTVKGDLFEDDVYVFTPKGDVYILPHGATPVDFAYRIHTQVGHTCIGAKVNGKIIPLSTALRNGSQVEIMTSKNGQPRLDWINFVITNQAKNCIRRWFKKERQAESIKRGRELLEVEFGKDGLEQFLRSDRMQQLTKKLNRNSVDEVLADIGYGELTPRQLLNRIKTGPLNAAMLEQKLGEVSQEKIAQSQQKRGTGILIGGEAGMLVHMSPCCQIVPGESIVGVITRNRGVSIHSRDCQNLAQVNENRFIPASWGHVEANHYPVELEIMSIDRRGLLKDLVSKMTDNKINILAANVSTHADKTATINMVVEVTDIKQLQNLMVKLRQLSDILNVTRIIKPSKTLKQFTADKNAKSTGKSTKK